MKTGKVYFEFRYFPFLGDESFAAAEAASCAADQNKFFEFTTTLWDNYLGENKGNYTKGRLKEMAGFAGLDTATFNTCLDDGTHKDDVAASVADGKKQGVNSTPTLFVDGKKIDYTGYDALKKEIDAALAAKGQ